MLGVVCGFRAEARCLPAGFATVVLSGGSSDRARARLAGLLRARPEALISFGVAGALDPDLRPGDLLVPAAVVSAGGERFVVDPDLGRRWRVVPDAAITLAGSDALIGTPAGKRDLRARTGAAAVDMESHVVAAAAAAAGLPFLVVRAIADGAGDRIPALASRALRPDGSSDVARVLAGLAARPADLPALVRLALRTRRALATLRRAGLQLARSSQPPVKPRA